MIIILFVIEIFKQNIMSQQERVQTELLVVATCFLWAPSSLCFHDMIVSYSLQVDRLEDELMSEQEKYKAITEELEQTFAEMSGY